MGKHILVKLEKMILEKLKKKLEKIKTTWFENYSDAERELKMIIGELLKTHIKLEEMRKRLRKNWKKLRNFCQKENCQSQNEN